MAEFLNQEEINDLFMVKVPESEKNKEDVKNKIHLDIILSEGGFEVNEFNVDKKIDKYLISLRESIIKEWNKESKDMKKLTIRIGSLFTLGALLSGIESLSKKVLTPEDQIDQCLFLNAPTVKTEGGVILDLNQFIWIKTARVDNTLSINEIRDLYKRFTEKKI